MTHLNDIQQLCTGDEEFVAGEIYGLRQWTLYDTLRPEPRRYELAGHRSHYWQLDKPNVAECPRTHSAHYQETTVHLAEWPSPEHGVLAAIAEIFQLDPTITSLSAYSPEFGARSFFRETFDLESPNYYPVIPPEDQLRYWLGLRWYLGRQTLLLEFDYNKEIPPHNIADPRCTCGFYAYTDEKSLLTNSQTSGFEGKVFGIIKAYGHVTEGTKGFRAEKAEIVALTSPQTTTAYRGDSFSWKPGGNPKGWNQWILPRITENIQVYRSLPKLISTFQIYQSQGGNQ